MAKADVILLKPVENLGAESDLVSVKAGYARNYLIPQGIAVPVTQANQRRIEALQKRRTDREAYELEHARELKAGFSKLKLMMAVRTGDDGKLFGSITTHHIADELASQFEIHIDRRKIDIGKPIKVMGEYDVDMALHADVHATLKVVITSTNPEAKLPEPKKEERNDAGDDRGRPRRPRAPRKDDAADAEKA